jgi:DNA-binding response OmpR family regulator
MKILLIEDDALTVESIKLCLELYEPESAITSTDKGLEAIQMLKADAFDVVVIDLGLPDIDGMQVLEQIRSFSKVPALILTARHNHESIVRSRELGANDFITKPFNYRLLLNQLHAVVAK